MLNKRVNEGLWPGGGGKKEGLTAIEDPLASTFHSQKCQGENFSDKVISERGQGNLPKVIGFQI